MTQEDLLIQSLKNFFAPPRLFPKDPMARYRFVFIQTILFLFLIFYPFRFVHHIFRRDSVFVALGIFILLAAFSLLVFLRRSKNTELCAYFMVSFALIIDFFTLFFLRYDWGLHFLWLFFFPLVSLFLLGKQKGQFFLFGFFLLLIAYLVLSVLSPGALTPGQFEQMLGALFFVVIFSLLFYMLVSFMEKLFQQLQKEQQSAREFADLLPQIVFEIDLEGHLLYANHLGFEYFDLPADLGERPISVLPFFPPEEHPALFQNLRQAVNTPSFSYRYTMIRKSGRPFPAVTIVSPVKKDGIPTGYRGILIDITEAEKAREALLASKEKYRELVENAQALIFQTSMKGNILFANDFALEFFGFREEELIGKHVVGTLFPPVSSSGSDLAAWVKNFYANPEKFPHTETECLSKTAQVTHISWTNKPLYDAGGAFLGILSVGRDITLEKVLQEKLLVSNRELESFAYSISHDLKEPLRMVQSFLALLEEEYSPKLDNEATAYIYYAVDGAKRMGQLISRLLEYSRLNFDKALKEPIKLSALLIEVKSHLSLLLKEKNAVLTIDPLPEIFGIPDQIFRLFLNLIGNALKFSRKDVSPLISLRAHERGDFWEFCLSDNGIGIPDDYQNSIFKVFHRLHTREEYPGIGIGLALCKKIVTLHGGSIWVRSKENQGSQFYFTLRKVPVDAA